MMANMTNQDQKKRTLDAIERRFALAETEIRLQQEKSKKRSSEDKNKTTTHGINSSSTDVHVMPTPSPNTVSKKGNFSFSGYTSKQDAELKEATYFQLSHPVHDNLLATNVKVSNITGTTVDRILHELLQGGDAAQKYMQGSRCMKIDNHVLLDNFVQKSSLTGGARIRDLSSQQSKRSKKRMSLKQNKKCGSFHLPKGLHNYETFKPMHKMWKDYIMRLIKNVGKNQLSQCLLSADLHGAIILVGHCKIASFIGVSGIMIRETSEAFGIITKDNKFRVVPKRGSVFMLQADCWKVTLQGDKLASRNLVP